jgi:hypothetical protein
MYVCIYIQEYICINICIIHIYDVEVTVQGWVPGPSHVRGGGYMSYERRRIHVEVTVQAWVPVPSHMRGGGYMMSRLLFKPGYQDQVI